MGAPKRLNQQQLLKISAELFGERGFHKTSVTDLTDALQISRPTLYSYAKSKDDLLLAVYDELLEFYSARLPQYVKATDSPSQRIEGFFRLQQVAIAEHRASVLLAFRNLHNTSAVHRDMMRSWSKKLDRFLLSTIDEGQKSGEFDNSINPTVFKYALLAILNNMPLWHDSVEDLTPEAILKQIMRMVVTPRSENIPAVLGPTESIDQGRSFSIRAESHDVAEASVWWVPKDGCECASLQDEGLALARWTCLQMLGGSGMQLTGLSVQWLRRDRPSSKDPLEMKCSAKALSSGDRSSTWHALLYVPALGPEAFATLQLTWISTAQS